jgi:hypothetical protein
MKEIDEMYISISVQRTLSTRLNLMNMVHAYYMTKKHGKRWGQNVGHVLVTCCENKACLPLLMQVIILH